MLHSIIDDDLKFKLQKKTKQYWHILFEIYVLLSTCINLNMDMKNIYKLLILILTCTMGKGGLEDQGIIYQHMEDCNESCIRIRGLEKRKVRPTPLYLIIWEPPCKWQMPRTTSNPMLSTNNSRPSLQYIHKQIVAAF